MHPHTIPPPALLVTDLDFARLQKYLDDSQLDAAEALGEELGRAKIVPAAEAPATLVTMNSRVVFENLSNGRQREVTLVYPHQANTATGCVSVLAPVGAALLGLSVGQEIEWPLPDGTRGRYRIVDILFQPEAAGQFEL